MKLIYNVKDRPSLPRTIIFALQQVLAILAATIVVPVIINGNTAKLFADGQLGFVSQMSQSAALLGAGVGTIVYLLFTKFKSPVFLGSSFAFLGSMTAAFAGAVSASAGYLGLIVGAILAGLVYVIIALVVKFVGVNWINKIMPAAVIGPTVAVIGLSLSGNAVGDLTKGAVATTNPFIALLCGLVTLATVIVCSVYGKKMLKIIPFIIGILAGYAVASIFTVIGTLADIPELMVINFGLFENMAWLPDFTFVEAAKGFDGFTGSYFLTVLVAYVPVAFVVFAEHIADHKNISSIIESDLLEDPGLDRTLLGDGVGSMAGAFFGCCPNTTYGESVGCVALTKNASIVTIRTAALLSICLAFFSPFVAFVNTIPSCVLGGICTALYGFIAVSGLKMIQTVDLNKEHNLFVVSSILVLGIGGFALNFGALQITSIAASLIVGILVNQLLKEKKA